MKKGEWKVVSREPIYDSTTIRQGIRVGPFATTRWRVFETRTNSNGNKFHRVREEVGPHTLYSYDPENKHLLAAMKAIHVLMKDIEHISILRNAELYQQIDKGGQDGIAIEDLSGP